MPARAMPSSCTELLDALEGGKDIDVGDARKAHEVLQEVPKGVRPRLYSALDTRVTLAFANGWGGELEGNEEEVTPSTPAKRQDQEGPDWKALHDVAVLVRALVEDGLSHAPPILVAAVAKLHDGALLAAAEEPMVQEAVSRLCESWWSFGLNDREALVPQTIPYLLVKALSSGRASDVKRCCAMKDALKLFDYEDASSIASLKRLLLRAAFAPVFLRVQEGRRFISCTFHLQPQMVRELVAIVKNQIPCGRKSVCDAYGEIIFKAWRDAAGPCLVEIEHSVIQDLMQAAIHASTPALGSSLRRVLEGIHAQKKQRGVDTMLTRLYEPILFRAFAVANPAIRRNAVELLASAFPLQESESDNETNEVLLQRQFRMLSDAMRDDSPAVRASASYAVARVLDIFWELIPSGTTSKLLSWMVDDLARDASSPSVRASALQSIALLIQNPLAQAVLKGVLPRLKPAIFDGSSKVRSAMADVLLAVRGIRAIHFYDIVPIEDILQSLGTDGPEVSAKLTKLLLPSYMPASVSPEEAASRVVALLIRSPPAGASFCRHLLGEIVDEERLWDLVEHLTAKLLLDAGARKVDKIDTCGWEGIAAGISTLCETLQEGHRDERRMKIIFGKGCLKLLLDSAPNSAAKVSILQVAKCMPAPAVKDMIKRLDHVLRNVADSKCEDLYRNSDFAKEVGESLSCMSSSGQAGDLFESIVQAFDRSAIKNCKDLQKRIPSDCGSGLNMEIAAAYLQLLLQNASSRELLLKENILQKALPGLRNGIVTILEQPEMRHSKTLAQLFMTYGKAALHLHLNHPKQTIGTEFAASEVLADIARWTLSLLEAGTPRKRVKLAQEFPEQRRSKRIKHSKVSVASTEDQDAEDDSGLTPAIDAALALLSEAAAMGVLTGEGLLVPSKLCASVLSFIAEQKRFCGQKAVGHSVRFVAASVQALDRVEDSSQNTELMVRAVNIVEEVMKMAAMNATYISTIRPWLASVTGAILEVDSTSWIEPVLVDLGKKWQDTDCLEDLGKALPHAILTAIGWPPSKATERSSKLMARLASCATVSWANKESLVLSGCIALLVMLQKRFMSMPSSVRDALQSLLCEMVPERSELDEETVKAADFSTKIADGLRLLTQDHAAAAARPVVTM